MKRTGILILFGLVLSVCFPVNNRACLYAGSESSSDTAENSFNIYFGDLHSHTGYSDGVETPEIAYRYARDEAKVDFLAVTDHAFDLDGGEYADIQAQASLFMEDGVFVAIAGQELPGSGHTNVFEADHVIRMWWSRELYQDLKDIGCIAQFNHPSPTDYDNFSYDPDGDGQVCLQEVMNPSGGFSQSYFYALSKLSLIHI